MKEIAIVCTVNNKADVIYENNEFQKIGEATEAALKVVAEKIGKFDVGNVDYT